jgi:hypothetical protein
LVCDEDGVCDGLNGEDCILGEEASEGVAEVGGVEFVVGARGAEGVEVCESLGVLGL